MAGPAVYNDQNKQRQERVRSAQRALGGATTQDKPTILTGLGEQMPGWKQDPRTGVYYTNQDGKIILGLKSNKTGEIRSFENPEELQQVAPQTAEQLQRQASDYGLTWLSDWFGGSTVLTGG